MEEFLIEYLSGGSIEKRSQFVSDIVKAVRENVDDEFIVGLRFSQWKIGRAHV